jgi:flagellum-specific ATP synthase
MPELASDSHRAAAARARDVLAAYRGAKDLIAIGAYVKGADRRIDRALQYVDGINAYLRQDMNERDTLAGAVAKLLPLAPEQA